MEYYIEVRGEPQRGPSFWLYPIKCIDLKFDSEQINLEAYDDSMPIYALTGIVACEKSEIVFTVKNTATGQNTDISCSMTVGFK